jgi:hypothetical protein
MDNQNAPSVSATVRRAKQGPDGSWFTVELSASRNVFNEDPQEDIKDAIGIAHQLDRELIEMFTTEKQEPAFASKPSSKEEALIHHASEIARISGEDPPFPPGNSFPSAEPQLTMECPDHMGVLMKRRFGKKMGKYFYSHNDESTGGQWCNYQPQSI